jgi:serine/threonine protein kinase
METAQLQAGTVFGGDFRIVRPLSQGGMGAVYAVEQISTGKPRALKLMLPQLVADPTLRKRFEQEARIGSRIESEHVVEVVGAGVDAATGMPWLAMELLQGEDLSSLVKRHGPLPKPTLLLVARQLGHAIGAAHDAGIVHRDLKPENIFLARSRRASSEATVKVLDFGIAKMVAESKSSATAAVGSPLWMAPEQTSRGGHIGPPTDVWSVGLIAFYLLTGRCFWRAAEDQSATMATLLREIVLDPLPPATERARDLGVALPQGFDAWFARAVERQPEHRFPTVREALAALERLIAGGPAVASPVDVFEPPHTEPVRGERVGNSTTTTGIEAEGEGSWRPPSNRGLLFGATALAAVALVGGTIALRSLQTSKDSTASAAPQAPAAPTSIAPTSTAAPSAPAPAPVAAAAALPVEPSSAPARGAAPPSRAGSPAVATAKRLTPIPPAVPAPAPTPRPAPAPALDCDPPYTTDADGIRHAKPGCT